MTNALPSQNLRTITVESFDITSAVGSAYKEERTATSFWLPNDVKEKYDRIQKLTKFKLGKHIIDLIIATIEDIDEKDVDKALRSFSRGA